MTKNAIFSLNNIIMSAYPEDKDLFRTLSDENNLMLTFVDKKLVSEFEDIKSGKQITYDPQSPPTLEDAVLCSNTGSFGQSFWEFFRLYRQNPADDSLLKSAITNLLMLKGYDVVLDHFSSILKEKMNDDPEIMNMLASAYFLTQEHYEEALPLYEMLKEVYPDSVMVFYRLALCYERLYQDKYLDKQLEYAKKAYEISDDENIPHELLAKYYYRSGNKKECLKCFDHILKNEPSPENKVAYGRFLMKEGFISEGFRAYLSRFDTGKVAYPVLLTADKRWNGKSDLSSSVVIVHYEQGFGDSVMFSRYIPKISRLAKKVIFVVQKNLIPVFKSSGFDKYCEILSHEADVNLNITLEDTNKSVMYSKGQGMGKIPHDYHIPLLDTPYLFEEAPDKMEEAEGYLKTDPKKVQEFREKYINKNDKIKVGLAYHGTKDSLLTYRDISVKKFLPLLKMDNVEFYSFQSDEYAQELQELDKSVKITDLGKVFKNFEDTACAMDCMDLIISTDNVVMNLAGALGVRTYALFNKFTESRWYSVDGDDIGWYKSVKPFHAKTFNDWDNLLTEVKTEMVKEFNL